MTSNIDTQLKSIQTKLQHLLKQYRVAIKENEQLKKQIAEKNNLSIQQQQQIQQIQQQLDALKIAGPIANTNDTESLQKKLDAYIKEIDKCLFMLSI